MDLTEAEDIKQRWQEYTEELYKVPGKELLEVKLIELKKFFLNYKKKK